MNLRNYNPLTLPLSAACMMLALSVPSEASEIYSGEPLAEALFDLAPNAILVAHSMSGGTERQRTDVFKLRDGRYVAITSAANKMDEPFTVQLIRVSSKSPGTLTAKTPTVQSLALPAPAKTGASLQSPAK